MQVNYFFCDVFPCPWCIWIQIALESWSTGHSVNNFLQQLKLCAFLQDIWRIFWLVWKVYVCRWLYVYSRGLGQAGKCSQSRTFNRYQVCKVLYKNMKMKMLGKKTKKCPRLPQKKFGLQESRQRRDCIFRPPFYIENL